MTLKGGTSQACAACKYQRRRCTSECPLAPYFPPDQPKLFQNAHRLFGVSNILKILKKIEPEHKATAMWSIIYQANERERDPVHGCLGKICQLRYQVWVMEQELLSVHARIDMCRQQQQQQQQIPLHHDQSQLELVMAPPSNSNNNNILSHSLEPSLIDHNNSNNNNNVGYNENGITNNDNNCMVDGNINPLWVQYPYTNDNNNGTAFIVAQNSQHHHHHHNPQPLDIQQEVVQDYDEMPFFDTMDDIDSKEAYESSSEESVMKDPNVAQDNLMDNELKNAAACLSLTSVN